MLSQEPYRSVVFNRIEDRLLKSPILKPLALNEVMKLNLNQIDATKLIQTNKSDVQSEAAIDLMLFVNLAGIELRKKRCSTKLHLSTIPNAKEMAKLQQENKQLTRQLAVTIEELSNVQLLPHFGLMETNPVIAFSSEDTQIVA
ncbi:hypothetical protein OUZ56_001791 [Daphnia magna]|uniref:Uncharacterized protein n=1 Tax=Daphnia magna TaxID=35525 RepID=A0ABR0A463_9CRUS|nr:hypothetical protein OUZ56_001791 [Daphnia magna]